MAVANTTRALGDMAAYHRGRNGASVVAITGSNGKTTTRQMTAAVVSRRYRTLSTRKNFNNDIGLPLTLLDLSPEHRWAVVEMGMNAPGEIRRLAEIGRPDIGVITNIAPAHLEGVGSIDGVMKAKGELLPGIAAEGSAVLNADDPRVLQLAARTDRRVLLYGLSPTAAVRAVDAAPTALGSRFTLVLPDAEITVALKTPGTFMIANALAAAAVGHLVGIPPAEIGRGLEAFEPMGGRMTLVATRMGLTLVDDTYNANPGSMAAALDTVKAMRGPNRSLFVMGDMKELGRHAQDLHRQVGALAVRSGVSAIFVTGEFAGAVAEGAVGEGLPVERIVTGSKTDLVRRLTAMLEPGDWVLIKGSRSMAMEEVFQVLKQWADGGSVQPHG
jgi:UDP-N-acetylmuramoyl-tripeptide--D-alanyl-D-alanine ligase